MNPGLCPKCGDPLRLISKGFISKSYSVSCSSCGSVWQDYSAFLNDMEQALTSTLKENELEPWPYEVPIMLKKNETTYLVREKVGIHEGRKYSYQGSSSGVSFRVASGVWLRQGSSSGSAESRDIMKLLDTGELTLTNQRLVFTGGLKTIEVPLDEIIAVDVKEDNLLYVARKNKVRIEAFSIWFPNLMKEYIIKVIEKNID